MKFSKEEEIFIANKLKEHYNCDIIFNDKIPYTLYNCKNIGLLLEHKNIRQIINQILKGKKEEQIFKIKIKTNGGLQLVNFINLDLLVELFVKSRKDISLDICKTIGININNYKFSCIENDTLKCIIDTFTGEKMIKQYKVNKMCLDLVFYKIIDGSKLELIRSFSINFLRDYYGELVNIILKNSTMHNPSESEVYICPSTNFIIIYDQFDEFCKNVYVDIDVEDKKINLIRAIAPFQA